MSLLKRIEISMLGAAMYVVAGFAMAEVVIVVSPSSPVTTLSQNQVVDIFLGKSPRLPTGERVAPVDLAEGTRERNEFYQKYAGKSPSQLRAHWSKVIFTGKGLPPKEVQRSQEVKSLINANPGLISYMDRSAVDSRVKVVSITE